MGRRQRRRQSEGAPAEPAVLYHDDEGNVLALRERLSPGTVARLSEPDSSAASSAEDRWQRRSELLFERLAVSWTVSGLPITDQRELLGRYRMADAATRAWVRDTVLEHVRRRQPELGG